MQTPSAPLLENADEPIQVSTAPVDGYNAGDMYAAPAPSAPYQAQAAGIDPANAPPLQKPTESQLGEGVGAMPGIVVEAQPTMVEGSRSDGVGMQEGCKRNPHVLTWLLTLSVWFLLCSVVVCNAAFSDTNDGFCSFFAHNIGAALGVLGAVAVVYWIECGCTGTGQYLRNVLQNEGAEQFVERLKAKPAVIRWNVACYHYETRTRTRTVTDSNGKSRTEYETYEEKVYTWRASKQYGYTTCIDVSGQLLGLDHYKLTKLRFHKTYGFVDAQSQNHYMSERRLFRLMNWRDVHQEFHEEYRIEGFVDRILAECEPGVKPGWMSSGCYWICNLLFMSPCFRHKMSAQCGNAQYTFVKQLSAFN